MRRKLTEDRIWSIMILHHTLDEASLAGEDANQGIHKFTRENMLNMAEHPEEVVEAIARLQKRTDPEAIMILDCIERVEAIGEAEEQNLSSRPARRSPFGCDRDGMDSTTESVA